MKSAGSASLVEVATNVIGIDAQAGLADDAFKDVGAGIEGGGSGGSIWGLSVMEGQQEDQCVQREEEVGSTLRDNLGSGNG